MEFALSQAVASGDAFEPRPSECGHCVQNFLADRDFRDLPGEAAGFELGADHALPTADLRFYPAALVVYPVAACSGRSHGSRSGPAIPGQPRITGRAAKVSSPCGFPEIIFMSYFVSEVY